MRVEGLELGVYLKGLELRVTGLGSGGWGQGFGVLGVESRVQGFGFEV